MTLTGTLNCRQINPDAHDTYDIGEVGRRWAEIYVYNIEGVLGHFDYLTLDTNQGVTGLTVSDHPTFDYINLSTSQGITGLTTTDSPTFNNLTLTGTANIRQLNPDANATYDIGEVDRRWRNLYLSGCTITDAGIEILGNIIIPDDGWIGSVTTEQAIQIEADGDVVMTGMLAVTGDIQVTGNILLMTDRGGIGYSDNSPMIVFDDANNRVEFVGNIMLADDASIGVADGTPSFTFDDTTSKITFTGILSNGTINISSSAIQGISQLAGEDTVITLDSPSTGDATFAGLITAANANLSTGELTCGSINRAADTLTLEIGGTAEISITSTTITLGGNLIIPDGGTIGSASDTDVMTIDASGNTTFSVFPITPSAAPDADYEVANKKYVDDNAGGGASTFVGLTDTPANFTGSAGKSAVVNSGETALEFLDRVKIEDTTRTVNLNNSMSQAELQAAIDAIGRNIKTGVVITVQFADGTYTLTDTLAFRGFWGGGRLYIYGNTGEANATDLHTTQSVYLDHGGYNGYAVEISACHLDEIRLYNLKIRTKSDSGDSDQCIALISNFGTQFIRYGYYLGTSATQGHGLKAFACTYVQLNENYVSNIARGISAERGSNLYSYENDDTGTRPAWGLSARSMGWIYKAGTQPAGSTANEFTDTGGSIT